MVRQLGCVGASVREPETWDYQHSAWRWTVKLYALDSCVYVIDRLRVYVVYKSGRQGLLA